MTSVPTQDFLTGVTAYSTTQGTLVSPFANAVISDSNDQTDVVTVFVLDDNTVAGMLDAEALPGGSYVATPDGSLLNLSGTPATVQAELRALQFKPAPLDVGSVQTAHLTVILNNTADSTSFGRSFTSATIQANGSNLVITGLPKAATIADTGSSGIFAGATIKAAAQDAVSVHVTMSDATLGSFDTTGLAGTGAVVTRNTDGSLTLGGAAAAVSAALQGLGFTPARQPTGTTGHESFTLAGTDSVNATTASATNTVDITGSAPVLTMSGVAGSSSAQGGADAALFANLALRNLSADTVTATVVNRNAASGRFDMSAMPSAAASGTTLTLAQDGATLTIAGSTDAVQAELRALRLQTVNPPSGTVVAEIGLTVSTASNQSVSLTEQLSIVSSGTSPVLTGNATIETSASSVAPYAHAAVSGPLTSIDATIVLSDPSVASFDQDGFARAEQGNQAISYRFGNAGASLEITGGAADLSKALQQLRLTAATPATATQARETATLTLTAATGTGSATTTILIDGPALVADTLSGVAASQAADGGVALAPFAQAVITDTNVGDVVTAEISADTAGFGTSGLAAGSVSLSDDGRVATLTGSAATVQAALRALTFTPAIAASNGLTTTTLRVALSNTAGSQHLAGGSLSTQLNVTAPPTFWSNDGTETTGHVFSVLSDPARTATLDLSANPNRDLVVFGGNSALDLTAGHSVVVLNGANQDGAVTIHSLGGNAVWVGAATVDYTAGGDSRFILGDMAATSSTVNAHGGVAGDSNEFDVWGDDSEIQTITTDGVARNLVFGGGANLAYSGGNSVVVLNGSTDTGAVSIQSAGGNTVWAGTATLDLYEGAGDDLVLLTGSAATTIHGTADAETGTTSVVSLSNTGSFSYEGGAKAAVLQLAGGTNSVVGGSARETISMSGTGSLLVSDDQNATGAQTIAIDQGFSGTMRFIGGANEATLQLGGGDAVVTAGDHTSIVGGHGTATIDLSNAVGALLTLDGSLVGTTDVMGFDPSQASAALTHVASSTVSGGSLVVTFTDGAQALFHGYADASHTGISFG